MSQGSNTKMKKPEEQDQHACEEVNIGACVPSEMVAEITSNLSKAFDEKLGPTPQLLQMHREELDGHERGRWNNIGIVGLLEDADGGNPVQFFETWLSKILNMETKMGGVKLERATQRAPRASPSAWPHDSGEVSQLCG